MTFIVNEALSPQNSRGNQSPIISWKLVYNMNNKGNVLGFFVFLGQKAWTAVPAPSW